MSIILSSKSKASADQFSEIVCIEPTGLTASGLERLQTYSLKPLRTFSTLAQNDEEILDRIGEADCVLLRWRTPINRHVITTAPALTYIGLCCSYFSAESTNIDVQAAIDRNLHVTAIFDYGDEGVVEFIISHLFARFGHYAEKQFAGPVSELGGKSLGIIGLGTTGQMVARAAQLFGMQVRYFSRTRKPEAEKAGISYCSLEQLMAESDVVSTHLPRHTRLLDARLLSLTRSDTLLVNTSLGPTFDIDAFLTWIRTEQHSAVFDEDGIAGSGSVLTDLPRTWVLGRGSGWTAQARERLSMKVLTHIENYFTPDPGYSTDFFKSE